jgi:adenylylsulfate kinase-like enzyme
VRERLVDFTGVSDRYELPDDAELTIHITYTDAEAGGRVILEAIQPQSR